MGGKGLVQDWEFLLDLTVHGVGTGFTASPNTLLWASTNFRLITSPLVDSR